MYSPIAPLQGHGSDLSDPERAFVAALTAARVRVTLAHIAEALATAERKGNAERADAIAQYERAATLAVSMGEGDRLCKRPLQSLSATELGHMAQQLGIALDKCAAGVVGYATPAAALAECATSST